MNIQERQYLTLLEEILDYGVEKELVYEDKLPNTVLSLFGKDLTFDCSNSIPILTTKKTLFRKAFAEILWMIGGTGDIKLLHDQKVYIWHEWGRKYINENTISQYTDMFNIYHSAWLGGLYLKGGYLLEILTYNFKIIDTTSSDPYSFEVFNLPLSLEDYKTILTKYAKSHRIPMSYTNHTNWLYEDHYKPYKQHPLDQTRWVIDTLRKKPHARHCVVSYWNPEEIYEMSDETKQPSVVLPSCVWSYQVETHNNTVNMLVNQRSADAFLGVPFNIAQYALLLNMYAKCLNMQPGELKFSYGDVHIYKDHVEAVREQLSRQPYSFPTLEIDRQKNFNYLQDFTSNDFLVKDYNYHKFIKAPITVVGGY